MSQRHRQHRSPEPSVCALTGAVRLALGAAAAGLLAHGGAWAQSSDSSIQRVEITGSAIRQIASETPLPVQIVTREEIDKAGVTTAAELMSRIPANVGGLNDGGSIHVGGDQRGFNSANLRGIGTSSTLVLLNGRRMANFASPGDDTGVDLNNIPAAALERVEVLLDGASALYGTDAIGGVINFITRKDFRGVEINAYGMGTREGGAGKRAATLTMGTGELEKDGYNVFAVVDVQRTDRLSTSQRRFVNELQIPQRLGHLLSSYTSPANIRLSASQLEHLQTLGFQPNGRPLTSQTINLSVPNCNPPANLYLPNGTGGVDACTYDYMGDTELYPKSQKQNLLTRGVLKLGENTEAYAEVALSRSRTHYAGSSARVRGNIPYTRIPALADKGFDQLAEDLQDEEEAMIELRMRLTEAGRRTSELTSESQRYVAGLTGTAAGWDYDVGLNHSVNTIKDKDTHGYLLYNELLQGIGDGLINPFGPSSAEGVALLDRLRVNDVVRRARGSMDSIDFKASRALMQLGGGDLALAVGAEARRERTDFRPSELLMSDNINDDFAPEGGRATSDRRKVYGVFGEILAPFSKQWQGQLSARYDHYQQVGGALSPKVGLAYTPARSLMLRASAGKGFRAPSMSELYRPVKYSTTATLPDPVYCATVEYNYADCANNWDTRKYSNENLKPERSRQVSAGLVIEPGKHFSASLDYWKIKRTDLISEIGDDVILANLDKYGNLVHRDEDDYIEYIDLHKENRGAQVASGLDLVIDLHRVDTAIGRFGARLSGTYVLDSKIQTGQGDAYISNRGRFVTDGVVQRWRHSLAFDWELGALSASLSNSYLSAYEDQNSAINIDDGSVVAANRVKAYSLWDMSLAYSMTRSLKLRAGVQNMFDKAPPYSNQAYFFLSGYDPSYTDPRGRRLYASVNYAFR